MNLSKKIREAIAYAAEKNGAKVRKDGLPGLTHALIVAMIVHEFEPGDENAIVAAILHDVFPNLKTHEREEVYKKFGPEVNGWLIQLADSYTGSNWEDDQRLPWKDRKIVRLAWLREVADDRLLLIYMADKLHNIITTLDMIENDGPEVVFAKFDTNPADMLWLDEERVKILAERKIFPELHSLYRKKIMYLDEYVKTHAQQKA